MPFPRSAVVKEPTRIVFLHRGGDQIRGSEQALLAILDGLDPSEFTASVLCSNPVLGAALDARDIAWRVQRFPEVFLAGRYLKLPLLAYVGALREIMSYCRDTQADIIVCNGGGPCQLGVPAARRLRLPMACLFYHPAPKAYHRAWLTRYVDRVIFASEFTARSSAANAGVGGDVVYVGVDEERVVPVQRDDAHRAALNFLPEHLVFAQVGALVPHKGHTVLLEAFSLVAATLPNARLLIVGAGPEESRLKSLAARLDLGDRVVFTGYVDDTLLFFQHVIDVNVLASHEEGLGLVNLEASACELPNIGTDGTGVKETIEHALTGFRFPDSDLQALAHHMTTLARDAALRREMGKAGRAMVIRQFSSRSYSTRVQAILRTLVPASH